MDLSNCPQVIRADWVSLSRPFSGSRPGRSERNAPGPLGGGVSQHFVPALAFEHSHGLDFGEDCWRRVLNLDASELSPLLRGVAELARCEGRSDGVGGSRMASSEVMNCTPNLASSPRMRSDSHAGDRRAVEQQNMGG